MTSIAAARCSEPIPEGLSSLSFHSYLMVSLLRSSPLFPVLTPLPSPLLPHGVKEQFSDDGIALSTWVANPTRMASIARHVCTLPSNRRRTDPLMLASTAAKMYLSCTRIHSEFIAICYLFRRMIMSGGLECDWCGHCVGRWSGLVCTLHGKEHRRSRRGKTIGIAELSDVELDPTFSPVPDFAQAA